MQREHQAGKGLGFAGRADACDLTSTIPAGRPQPRTPGRRTGPGPRRLRDALDATHQGNADLPAHEEPARRATAAWTFQAVADGEVSGYRGRCRPRDFRADGNPSPTTAATLREPDLSLAQGAFFAGRPPHPNWHWHWHWHCRTGTRHGRRSPQPLTLQSANCHPARVSGRRVTGWPLAAKSAAVSAGAIEGVHSSPTPAARSPLASTTMSRGGTWASLRIG
jgi:hypothetical protein